MVRQREKLAGVTHERRVLDDAVKDHCQTCLDEAERDWQPIGTLTPIGSADCMSRDRCYFEYDSQGAE
jgi:hypothetical protein